MKGTYKILTPICVILACLALLGMSAVDGRPKTLSIDYSSHIAVPAVNKMELNNRMIVSRSLKGRSESGGIEYLDKQGDALVFNVFWYDIVNEKAYTANFTVAASELSIVESLPGYATIDIVNGPGADVTVTTMNKYIASIIGKRNSGNIITPPDQYPPITLREICAEELPPEDIVAMELAAAARDPNDEEMLSSMMGNRERYLIDNPVPASRCAEGGEK